MTVDLWCLVANALWGLGLVLLEIGGKTRIAGAAWNAGNRETSPEFPAWIKRTSRALDNHKENFPLFLSAVVVVQLAGRANRASAIAAVVYVVARALHGVLFVAGITGLRTLAFIVGVLACLAIFAQLV